MENDNAVLYAKMLNAGEENTAGATQQYFVNEIKKRSAPLMKSGMTEGQAFEHFIKNDPEGRELYAASKIVPVAAQAAVEKRGGKVPVTGGDAHDKLMDLAKELRKTNSKLSLSQAFAQVYADPANAALARAERAANRPA